MSVDHFAILGVPRCPWLDEALVRDQFQRRAAILHPDGAASESAEFIALNSAWQCLRSPTARLRHYLELEHPEVLQSPPGTAPVSGDLFMQVAEAQQQAGVVSARFADAKIPLARALLEPQRVTTRALVDAVAARVAAQIAALHQRVQAPDATSADLAECLGHLAFLEKWSAQLRERAFALG